MAAKNMICLIVLLISASFIFFGTCSGGDRIESNHYQIVELDNLGELKSAFDDWVKCFLQTADIGASVTFSCNGGTSRDFTNIRAIEVSSNDGYPYLQMLLIALVSTTDHFMIEGQIQPNIQEIRKLLKRNDFRILNEFTQIV